jgi:zinc transport system substrate-binding protein
MAALALLSVALGAAGPAADAPTAPLPVFVSILPQAWFVERIGGPYVDVGVLVGAGQSPHAFDPTPRQVTRLAQARIFLRIGWPFEKELLRKAEAVNPNLIVIDTREGVPLRWMTPAEADADANGRTPPGAADQAAAGAADHPAAGRAGDPDPHSWLNPRLAKVQAATIEKALAAADPAHADAFRKNLAALLEDLDRLDARLREVLAPLKGKAFFVYHPAFGYFADAYGLVQVPVEIEGKEPGARQLAALVARAKADGVRIIFVQPQFSARSARAVAEAIGGAVIPMDPLAGDYAANLLDMAGKIRQALGAEKK